eukprot:TRINITY_DN13147_c0_g1_i1.p1 TRINITY_DN13147_c0_g1~~TRINITY_DN13147_c0_g1_i1.p1  ORF type:complete len:106 (+),score=7.37 TRINITY_DN13147_c0_g1_i1:84-401(+)
MSAPLTHIRVRRGVRTIYLPIELDTTIIAVKHAILPFFPSLTLSNIRLLKGQFVLEDSHTLTDLNVASNDLIFLQCRAGPGVQWEVIPELAPGSSALPPIDAAKS